MPAVQRVGDKNSAGGQITQGDNSVLVNGKAIGIANTRVSGHQPYGKAHPPHAAALTKSSKNTTVLVNGRPALVTGDNDTCGHARVGGSINVTIG